ncbi:MAG: tyrosine-type recombinase/integrase [Clostridiales bacterium]|nr:tyrosine-type recombinase/integrase [Clostridiales bacterium]
MSDLYNNYVQKHLDILSLRDLAPGTISSYASYLNQFLDWVGENLPGKDLSQLTFEEIRLYLLFLKNVRSLNNRTINYHIAQLRDFFLYVLHREWERYQVPYLKYDQFLPAVPTRQEVDTIIDSISNSKHKAAIALLYSSGLRVSELCRLHCGDIHASGNRIYVSRSKNRSDRYAVLSSRALDLLTAYIRSDYRDATKDSWLFPGARPDSHVCTQTVYNILKHQLASLGWQDKGFNCHSLRHAFGLHLYEAGTDLISIKEALGHKSMSSTEIYLSLGIGSGRSVKSPYDL